MGRNLYVCIFPQLMACYKARMVSHAFQVHEESLDPLDVVDSLDPLDVVDSLDLQESV